MLRLLKKNILARIDEKNAWAKYDIHDAALLQLCTPNSIRFAISLCW